MKNAILFFLLVCSLCSSSQILQDVTGQPYIVKGFEEYTGSPLLFKTFLKGIVTTANGQVYKNMLVNVDVNKNTALFMRENNIYSFSENVNEFNTVDSATKITLRRGTIISIDLPNVLMEVISEKPLLLIKHDREIVEVPGYGNGMKSYRYIDSKAYYTSMDNKIRKINLSKDNAKIVFAQKWNTVEALAKQINKCFTTETGWRKMAEYYISNQ